MLNGEERRLSQRGFTRRDFLGKMSENVERERERKKRERREKGFCLSVFALSLCFKRSFTVLCVVFAFVHLVLRGSFFNLISIKDSKTMTEKRKKEKHLKKEKEREKSKNTNRDILLPQRCKWRF